MIQPVHIDTETGQQIAFPAPRWTVKRVPGNTSVVIIDPTGDTLRIPDEVADRKGWTLERTGQHIIHTQRSMTK